MKETNRTLSQAEAKWTDVLTDTHPHGEAAPGGHVQLHHEIDVDKDTEQGQPGQQRHLCADFDLMLEKCRTFKI